MKPPLGVRSRIVNRDTTSHVASGKENNKNGDKYHPRKKGVRFKKHSKMLKVSMLSTMVMLIGMMYNRKVKSLSKSCGKAGAGAGLSPAFEESLSFFDDIQAEKWALMKEKVKSMNNISIPISNMIRPEEMYQHNYHPNFLCTHERRIGRKGDGGKWACDPHRISQQKKCLVYSVGSNGDYSFERAVKKNIGKHCEIHTFDYGRFGEGAIKADSNYHRWGISNVNNDQFKTLERTIEVLGHEGRTIDIFKIDCEGCEWDTFQAWLGINVTLRQILVEVHHNYDNVDFGKTNRFYDSLREEGYVIFHREANIQYSFFDIHRRCLEIGFLKLSQAFFN
eukprot:CAMPEP_0172512340 /NCGR_PEP_ID=MMETSP1066-20121228/243794_1 /TAXON_ID=671091 /ORGANISM="Coscinodiscus wailesii, Strain CCMP2513" /LENGTH=335 /DNA_ID=CAMNT_0013292111 /DNA_START=104 /DNA_END=1111 /DNA_ORIENTATION=-